MINNKLNPGILNQLEFASKIHYGKLTVKKLEEILSDKHAMSITSKLMTDNYKPLNI